MATGGQVTTWAGPPLPSPYVGEYGTEIQLLTFNSFHFSHQ